MCIIGNGVASIEAIRALRENGYNGNIDLISDSFWPSHNPMLTTYYVSKKIDFPDMFPFGYNMDFYNKYDVKLHLGSPVIKLDTENRLIESESGAKWKYDKCLVATGASPFLPPINGIDNEKVYTMRTVDDALRLKEAIVHSPKTALVVGASMVGIKVVELLNDAGIKTSLADQASCIFPLAAHAECAKIIQDKLIEKDVELKFDASIARIEETSKGLKAYFSDSETIETDLIVMCIGVRPNINFIDKKQILVDKGIIVDEHMRTNDMNVYAAGDVSQGVNLLTGRKEIIGLWTNARYQGRTAGRNMAGYECSFEGNSLHNITHFMDILFTGLGDPNGGNRYETLQNEDSYVRLAWDDDNLVGVNMIGDSCSNIGIIKNALEKSPINKSHLKSDSLCSDKLRDNILIKYFSKEKV